MKKIIIGGSILIILSGCVTFGQMETGLKALMGHDERVAFDLLGYPSAKQQFGEETVYTWAVSNSGVLIMPQTATTTGYVGSTPVYGTTTYSEAVSVNYSCKIKLISDSNNVLRKWEYEGNIGGCESYINRLNTFTKPKLTKPN